jgi:L-lactate dehydrogenase complex protein LldF
MTATFEKFHADARKVIADPRYQFAIEDATHTKNVKRTAAAAAYPPYEAMRDHLKAVRSSILSQLGDHLETFEKNALAAGANVHWAENGEAACRIITDICQRHNATRVVKGKSMASEEVHLNRFLENEGISPIETDLGEWIIQQVGDPPAHIIAPAIHLTRFEIAKIFEKETGKDVDPENVEGMTAMARRILRDKFLNAEVGITGGNVAIAESGSIVLVMNEGNGRMTTSLPPVLIMLIGIEKIVPNWNDASAVLSLLARAATGQALSQYTTIVTGPRREDESEGPEEVHYVLLDNGRSRLIGTKYEEILRCIRCGTCLNVCPVYRKIGGSVYNTPVSGPIGSVFTPLIAGLKDYVALPHASTLCGECLKYCPVRIDFPRMFLDLRSDEVEKKALPWRDRVIERFAARVMSTGWLYHLTFGIGRIFQVPFIKDHQFHLPKWINPAKDRRLPALGKRSFHQVWAKGEIKDDRS